MSPIVAATSRNWVSLNGGRAFHRAGDEVFSRGRLHCVPGGGGGTRGIVDKALRREKICDVFRGEEYF